MTTAETVTLTWSPDSKAAPAPAGVGGSTGQPALVIPARLGSVKLIRELGHGGMGVVWLGHHEFLDRQVAVKFLLATVTDRDDPRFQVFLDGARAAAQVRHLGLTAVLHADIIENVPYLVMEYVSGPTLAELVERTGPLRLPAVLAVLERVADAIDELHEAGVIHRDLKPSNILVDVQGQAYLTDFGLACRVENRERVATSGTPTYMAPECFEGEVSARTDIYALAATVYHLLSGRAPYSGSVTELRDQHKTLTFPIAPLQSAAVPQAVIECLQRAANTDPRFRTKSAHKVLEGFREAAGKMVTAAAGVDQLARLVAALKSRQAAGPATLVSAIEGSTVPPTPGAISLAGGSPPFEAEAAILGDPVPCVQCGYELRGLPIAARCPECQRPIEHSLRSDRLIFADPAWLRRVNLGLWLMAIALGVTFAVFVGLALFRIVADTLPPRFAVWGACASIATMILLAASSYLACSPEPGERAKDPYRAIHWVVGMAANLIVVVLCVCYSAFIWNEPGTVQEPLIGLLVWTAVSIVICALPAQVCSCVCRLLGRGPVGRGRWLDFAARFAAWLGAAAATLFTAIALSRRVLSDQSMTTDHLGTGFAAVASFGTIPVLLALAVLALRIGFVRKRLLTPMFATVPGSGETSSKSSTYYQSLSTFAGRRRVATTDATPDPAIEPAPNPCGVLLGSVSCITCGGDLKGQHVNTACPKCGAAVRSSLYPARLVFAKSEHLHRAARGLDRAGLTLLIGLLLLGVTVPFQLLVKGASGTMTLIYAPLWIAVVLVALDGCRVGTSMLGCAPADAAASNWRKGVWAAALFTIASVLGYGVWLRSISAFQNGAHESVLLGWPAMLLLVPLGVVPVVLGCIAAPLAIGGYTAPAQRLRLFASLLPIGFLGLSIILFRLRSSEGSVLNMAAFISLLVASIPAAYAGLKIASKSLRNAAEAHADYQPVRAAIDSAEASTVPPFGGSPSQPA